jgi:hypothetical protein
LRQRRERGLRGIMPLSLDHERRTQLCRCARSYSIIGVNFRTIFDSLPEWAGEKRCQWGGVCKGRQGGQTKGRGEKKNEDERNIPVLLREAPVPFGPVACFIAWVYAGV